jgi:Mg/Co/Ni transporter MgtE
MSQDSLDKDKKEKIVINLDEDKIKAVSDTYSLYTSTEVEAGKVETKRPAVNRELSSMKSLKPELNNSLRNIMKTIPKEQVKKLVNPSEEQKGRLFNKQGANAFGSLSEEEKAILIKKMDGWKVEETIAEANATVAINWVNNVAKGESNTPNPTKKATGSLNSKQSKPKETN